MKYKPSDFNKKAQFGVYETIEDDLGNQKAGGFVPRFTLHYMTKLISFNHQFSIQGTMYENTTTIIVKHNQKLSDQFIVKLPDNNFYEIVTISQDDSNNVFTYDFVTLKRKK